MTTQAPPEVAPPTEPGWYAYDGGRQNTVFYLGRDDRRPDGRQWFAHFDNGTSDECEWGYIEQALSVWNLVPLVPTPAAPPASVADPTPERLEAERALRALYPQVPASVADDVSARMLAAFAAERAATPTGPAGSAGPA